MPLDKDMIKEMEAIADQRHRRQQQPRADLPRAGVGLTQHCLHCGASYRLVGTWLELPPCPNCKGERKEPHDGN